MAGKKRRTRCDNKNCNNMFQPEDTVGYSKVQIFERSVIEKRIFCSKECAVIFLQEQIKKEKKK